jgi:hypothetical protein
MAGEPRWQVQVPSGDHDERAASRPIHCRFLASRAEGVVSGAPYRLTGHELKSLDLSRCSNS